MYIIYSLLIYGMVMVWAQCYHGYMLQHTCLWRPEDNLQKLFSFFHRMSSEGSSDASDSATNLNHLSDTIFFKVKIDRKLKRQWRDPICCSPRFSPYLLLRYNVNTRTLTCEDLGEHRQAVETDFPVIKEGLCLPFVLAQHTHKILVPCSYLAVLLVILYSSWVHLRPTSRNT